MKYKILAFTGLRPHKLPFKADESNPNYCKLKEMIRKKVIAFIKQKNVNYFISGMAMGADLLCASVVIELKKDFTDLVFEGAIPCKNQHAKWPQIYKDIYTTLLEQCDYLFSYNREYTDTCMMDRNQYMVNKADYLLAIWDNRPGGTANTIQMATIKGIPILIIDPVTFEVYAKVEGSYICLE